MNQERQREKEGEERFDRMEKWTNLAWPTSGDSDVPPAEKRANRIYVYVHTCSRGSEGFFRKNGDREDNSP